MSDPASERIEYIRSTVRLRSSYAHYEGRNDYTKIGSSILEIVVRDGRAVEPGWERRWTRIAEGVKTRHVRGTSRVRISARACPVRVRVRHWSEYVSYTDSEHCSLSESIYWVRYERAHRGTWLASTRDGARAVAQRRAANWPFRR